MVMASERFLENVMRQPVGIVVFGDVHTNDAFNLVVEQLHQQLGGLVVRKMPTFGRDSILQIARIGAVFEHAQIVIRLKRKDAATDERLMGLARHDTRVGHKANRVACAVEPETERLGSIVERRKRMDRHTCKR